MSREKKQELRTQGRTEEEVSDRTLFGCCHKYEDVETVSVGGLHCGMKFLNSCLGQCYHDDDDDARVSSRRRHKRLTRQTSRHGLQSLIKQKKTARKHVAIRPICCRFTVFQWLIMSVYTDVLFLLNIFLVHSFCHSSFTPIFWIASSPRILVKSF